MTIKFQDSVVIGSGYWGSNIIRELYKKKDSTVSLKQIKIV